MVAAAWLTHHGYSILRRNWKWGDAGEIDLVCRNGDELVFAEVKTRRRADAKIGTPARAVNREKRDLIRKGARKWLGLLGDVSVPYRYDVVEVVLTPGECPHVSVLKSAFGEREG